MRSKKDPDFESGSEGSGWFCVACRKTSQMLEGFLGFAGGGEDRLGIAMEHVEP
jgi:hypothetical protein